MTCPHKKALPLCKGFFYLNHPNFGTNSNDTDYSKTPVNITGYVSNPQAEVKINDIPVNVNEDGTFLQIFPVKIHLVVMVGLLSLEETV